MKAIQFKVDMSLQSTSADSIHIAGSFQGWDPSKTMMVNFDGVHRYVAYVNPGDSVYFKFINGNDWSSVEACAFYMSGIFCRVLAKGTTDSTQML
jgi:hypothetical protein